MIDSSLNNSKGRIKSFQVCDLIGYFQSFKNISGLHNLLHLEIFQLTTNTFNQFDLYSLRLMKNLREVKIEAYHLNTLDTVYNYSELFNFTKTIHASLQKIEKIELIFSEIGDKSVQKITWEEEGEIKLEAKTKSIDMHLLFE